MFDRENHYWVRKDGRIYSSREQEYVSLEDPYYILWIGQDNVATPFPKDEDGHESEQVLWDVLFKEDIEILEKDSLRSLGELNDPATSENDRTFASQKLASLNEQKAALRSKKDGMK